MKKLTGFGLMMIITVSSWGQGEVGRQLTRFDFPANASAAEWQNGFMESFFTNRINIGPPIFPREYLAIADSWLNDAHRNGMTIQEYTRQSLLDDRLDAEGYVFARQHGASSHDHGWPFPHWIQVPGKDGWKGVTAGWHFYDDPKGWEIVYPAARKSAPNHFGEAALDRWNLSGFESKGINPEKSAWELMRESSIPTLTSPERVTMDAFNCPFIQIRWNVEGQSDAVRPYMEWMCEGDDDWNSSRCMNFYADWLKDRSDAKSGQGTGMFHSILPLHTHPKWKGKITRIRFCMAADDRASKTFYVRSIFSHWDTRHLVNNAIYVKSAFEYFRWTGDVDFLRTMLPNLRIAMRYMMKEGHGLELNHIRCTMHGHDGRAGYTVNANGSKTWNTGHGKGGNYWDLLPLGWDDMYTTTHYYASLLAMAQLEEVVAEHPGFALPRGFMALDAAVLRAHAAQVKESVNATFFDDEAGRFVGCIDADGIPHDYGFTFINLEAIHYGIASDTHAKTIMKWINGDRMVQGDTSTGADIYRYRLAPRATTKRNVEWYSHNWPRPEKIPFGGQVQDGGAVLGFSFYDIMSRIKTIGADNAWARLMAIREWDDEVRRFGGYRKYYNEGKGGTTLQGGGTAGGVGIDFEFTESSMLSAVVPLGFMGLRPDGLVFNVEPNLPTTCPEMKVRNLNYQGAVIDVGVTAKRVELNVHKAPFQPFNIRFKGKEQRIDRVGTYAFK